MNTLQSTGEAWPALEEKVDSFVEALIAKNNLPGMTVAVTKEGRLLLSKGYGYALVDGTRKLPMKPCLRSRCGSVGKPLFTGSSVFQLMKSKNIDPKSTKPEGVTTPSARRLYQCHSPQTPSGVTIQLKT